MDKKLVEIFAFHSLLPLSRILPGEFLHDLAHLLGLDVDAADVGGLEHALHHAAVALLKGIMKVSRARNKDG